MDNRARLTVPDTLFVLMSLAVFGALVPVMYAQLEKNAGTMTAGELYVFQLISPVAVLVLLSLVFVKATGGGA